MTRSSMRRSLEAALLVLFVIGAAARAQTPGAGGAYSPGAGGSAVSSVTGTSGQVTASPTTGAVVVGLPATITSNENFTGTFEIGGFAVSLAGSLTTSGANALTLTTTGTTNSTLPSGTHSLAPLDSPTFSGTVTMPGSGTFTSSLNTLAQPTAFTSTSTPTMAPGTLALTGAAPAPAFGANGEGGIYLSSTNGVVIGGLGSSNDVYFTNHGNNIVCSIQTSSGAGEAFVCNAMNVNGAIAPSTGIYRPATNTLGFAANTTEEMTMTTSALTLLNSMGLTAPGTITFAGVTTGTNADFACFASGGVMTLQSSSCTISSLRFKKNVRAADDRKALAEVLGVQPIDFEMKEGATANPDPNYRARQTGLSAESVAKTMPECAIYENDMATPKSWRQECVIAKLIGAVREIEHANDNSLWHRVGVWAGLER